MASQKSQVKGGYYSFRTAALRLGVTQATLRKLISHHNMAIYHVPGHNRRYVEKAGIESLVMLAGGQD